MTTPNASEQAPPQTALATGATGFIGGHLVRHLARLGWKVHALARQVSTDPDIALAATWHSYDGDYESVSRAVASSEPDVVFHLASLFLSEHKPEQIDALVNANLRFGMHLLEAMHQHNVRRLINTGTSWQHYNNSDYDPVNLYAATKQAFEAIIDYYCNAHQLSAITIKLADTYAENDTRKKIVPLLKSAIIDQKPIELTDGHQKLAILRVSDVCAGLTQAHHLLATQSQPHKRYALINPETYTIREIAQALERQIGKTGHFLWGRHPSKLRQPTPTTPLVNLPQWEATYLSIEEIIATDDV